MWQPPITHLAAVMVRETRRETRIFLEDFCAKYGYPLILSFINQRKYKRHSRGATAFQVLWSYFVEIERDKKTFSISGVGLTLSKKRLCIPPLSQLHSIQFKNKLFVFEFGLLFKTERGKLESECLRERTSKLRIDHRIDCKASTSKHERHTVSCTYF